MFGQIKFELIGNLLRINGCLNPVFAFVKNRKNRVVNIIVNENNPCFCALD